MIMKRKILFLLLLMFSYSYRVIGQHQLYTCAYVHGYWTDWYNRYSYSGCDYKYWARKHDYNETFCGLTFADRYEDKWDWFLNIQINDYVKPDKKEIKRHLKSGIWYEYSGTVEYYVSDEFPTIIKVLEYSKFPFISPTYKSKGSVVKRTAKAIIKIEPYKKAPRFFKIYFDGCGIAIDWVNLPFDKKYFVK